MRWMWIDRVLELKPRERVVAIKHVSLAEDHLHDHFSPDARRPGLAVMPASLIIEGVAQAGGLLVGSCNGYAEKVVLAKIGRAEITREATPGCTLRYTVRVVQVADAGASTEAVIELRQPDDPAGRFEKIGEVSLMFSHLDKNMAGLEFPDENFVYGDAFATLLRSSGIDPPGGKKVQRGSDAGGA